jgi:hypothetical protein
VADNRNPTGHDCTKFVTISGRRIQHMSRSAEEQLLHPEPGSAVAAARDFGIDLTLLVGRLRLTPEERLEELQRVIDELEEGRRAVASAGRNASHDKATTGRRTVR